MPRKLSVNGMHGHPIGMCSGVILLETQCFGAVDVLREAIRNISERIRECSSEQEMDSSEIVVNK